MWWGPVVRGSDGPEGSIRKGNCLERQGYTYAKGNTDVTEVECLAASARRRRGPIFTLWLCGIERANWTASVGEFSALHDSKWKSYGGLEFGSAFELQIFTRIFTRHYTAPEAIEKTKIDQIWKLPRFEIILRNETIYFINLCKEEK
jgi:hypothetical protein